MHNIVIIGAGQLGRRHLQGLANSGLEAKLHVVDPFESSLVAAKKSLEDLPEPAPLVARVLWHRSAETLPSSIDLAIVATTADVRLAAMRSLCEIVAPRYMVIEKVLFQRFADYEEATELLSRLGVTAWVNCPRRAMPIYRSLATFFADDPIRRMELHGGDWGMGCNSIHFLDLLAFLNGTGPLELTGDQLETGVRKSKRDGFVEYAGTLHGSLGGANFCFSAIAGSTKKHLMSLHGGSKSVFIDEMSGELWKHDAASASLERFSLPYQSQLTGPLAEAILSSGNCPLTPFSESTALHLPLLSVLAHHEHGAEWAHATCHIT